ncbi:hypothetical protein [Polyangium sp. y55x31]|uniref:hypothetical protein n=1 Tax=Polyangium sp. y55x31 TaxID=3042688 RepID=UPI0024826C47|nr:hypothetical protein [Polyangium sp. y55x31]MDI1479136.1 hypothetical protein [Polyangium sp. y55x31]
MKKLACMVGLTVVFAASSLYADVSVTGRRARNLWNALPGPVTGPYCMGLCMPGEVCDAPCYSYKSGNGWECTYVEYLGSGRKEYTCTMSR